MSQFAANANVPDKLHIELMEEQRQVMMNYLSEPDEVLKDMNVVATLWCDPERNNDKAVGGTGCWGSNIIDVRLESRRFRKTADGNKVPGSETRWELCQILQHGTNHEDHRTVIDADSFYMITADDDGGNKARKSLKEITKNVKRFFPSEGLEKPKMTVERVAVGHRMAFVPVPKDTDVWAVEVRYVSFGYNTVSKEFPKNLLLFGDTMNCSIFSERPGHSDGFQPMYHVLRTSVGGHENEEPKMRCFATSVEATDRSIKNIGTETVEESAAAAASGRGTQVRTGPASLPGTSSCAWHVAIPIEAPAPAMGLRCFGEDDGAIYRSLGSIDDDDDDGIASEDRVRPGEPAKRASAREARIGIGTYVEDATKIAVESPVATSGPAIASSISIMCIPMGTVPSKECVVDAAAFIKKRYRQTNEVGAATEVRSRFFQEAVDTGLTVNGPVSKKSKSEIEAVFKCKMIFPGTNEEPEIAQGRPLLTGVPTD